MDPTGDLMPITNGLHPNRRANAEQTKGDTMAAPAAPAGSLYVVTSYTWDDRHRLEGLGQPDVHATAAAATAAARALMRRCAEVFGDADADFDFRHNEDQEGSDAGLYNGKLVWKGAKTAAEVRVFRVDAPVQVGRPDGTSGKSENGKIT